VKLVLAALERVERSLGAALEPLSALVRAVERAKAGRVDVAALERLAAALRALEWSPHAVLRELEATIRAARPAPLASARERVLGFSRELQVAARKSRVVPRLI